MLVLMSQQRKWPIKRAIQQCVIVSLTWVLSGCSTTSWPSIAEMMNNIAAVMPDVLQLVSAASYLFGIGCIMRGIYKLREYGELRTMTSNQTSIVPTLTLFCVGAGLLYFPSAYELGLQTIFGYSSPLAYAETGNGPTEEMISAVVLIMQVMGAVAFIKGMLMLNNISGQGAQPGTFSKALTHIIGGLCAINIYGTWSVISNTLLGT